MQKSVLPQLGHFKEPIFLFVVVGFDRFVAGASSSALSSDASADLF
jgi:hypothetical protein